MKIGPGTQSHARAAVSTRRLYWGAWIGKQLTGEEAPWDMNAVRKFERLAGKGVSLVEFSSPWADCRSTRCTPYKFPGTPFERIRRHGAIPVFSWASYAPPLVAKRGRYQLGDIIRGDHDRYITTWAKAAKSWGHPFFLRFDWEMNGAWFPWSERSNGNRQGEFVAMWRHVHDIFRSVGASNVTWVWCPNIDYLGAMAPLAGLYPGDRYVDWTCLDGYNFHKKWRTFDELYRSTYDVLVAVAPSKPVMVGEIASHEQGGSKAAWISDVLEKQFRYSYSHVKAFVWFEKYDSGQAWPIETSLASRKSFAEGIASDIYVPNRFKKLAGGPIRPPRAENHSLRKVTVKNS